MSLFGADFGGDCAEDRLDERPRAWAAAGHEARAEKRPLFAAGDAGADE